MIDEQPAGISFDPVMSRPKAAEYLGMSLRSLDDLWEKGTGPARVDVLGGRCGYRLSALNAWLDGRTRRSSADMTVQRHEAEKVEKKKAARAAKVARPREQAPDVAA